MPVSLPLGLDGTLLSLCNVVKGRYVYMQDLAQLQHANQLQVSAPLSPVQQRIAHISSPLVVSSWQRLLAYHPDEQFRTFVIEGTQQGFHIGFDASHPTHSSRRNIKSAYEHQHVVQEYLDREVLFHRLFQLQTDEAQSLRGLQLNPLGVIPKRGHAGKWHLIVDLSLPEGRSINEGISLEYCSIS